ncbi:cytochrome-c peroxidase [Shewanella surugensis]|nr:cytochrome-c peroxidase [Shewanella surugensis]
MSTNLLFATSSVAQEPISIIEAANITEPEKVALGKMLYFDPRLSKSGYISCNSCHNLATAGVDSLATSIGDQWQQGPINSPTVLNSRYNIAQFWDGRAKDLKEQAGGPIANPKEMGSTHSLAVTTIASIPEYQKLFADNFDNNAISIDTITDAIAAFEETLVTPNSPFDQYLMGNKQAISSNTINGYRLFKEVGCVGCHNGPAAGNNMYMKMGVVKTFVTTNPAIGRQALTGKAIDKNVFKVPTLRNIELTYPYFHDGSVWTLEEAVTIMADIQLGKKLSEKDTQDIVLFLQSLTGDQPQIVLPILPPSNKNTPKPTPFIL